MSSSNYSAAQVGGTDSFNEYLSKYKGEAREEISKEYYHVNVVADAYNQGFTDGKKEGSSEFIEGLILKHAERFAEKSQQVYILSKRFIAFLKDNQYNPTCFFVSIKPSNPRVLVAISENLLLDDDFVKTSYEKVAELKKIFFKLFGETLDMGLINSEELDQKLLSDEGFGYKESVS